MLKKRQRILPPPMTEGSAAVADLIDNYFNAYNSARVREVCQLFTQMVASGATVGVSLSGALTPAGLSAVLTPLIERGFIDYISSTGANLYHDLHFDLGYELYRGGPGVTTGAADVQLRKDGVIRVYDVLFDADVLYRTDDWLFRVLTSPEFKGRMGGARLHNLIGKYALETARQTGAKPSILATCHALDVPVWSPSPGDSTIGMNLAALGTLHAADDDPAVPHVDPSIDVNDMAAVVLDAKRTAEGTSGVVIFGGGAPKNFLLQTEPQLQEILGVAEKGHDYFIQITDARADTGGLSGATPAEAVSWGKVDPDKLPNSVVAYCDSTIVMPLLASYVLSRCPPREPRRLYARLGQMRKRLADEFAASERLQRLRDETGWGK